MILKEVWKTIEDFPDYSVSTFGGIYSHRRNRELRPCPNARGYMVVQINNSDTRKTFRVHRLVAQAFIGHIEPGYEVNHIDGNKQNNHLNNLEIVTSSENTIHAHTAGLVSNSRWRPKKVINVQTGDVYESMNHAARAFGVSPFRIHYACNHPQNKIFGYNFEYYRG